MDLHVFNPEHEIALAYNKKCITAPHTVQEFRMNLGWIPALWAADGDVVLVDDAKYAVKAASKMKGLAADVLFLEKEEVRGMLFDSVKPWGWDRSICTALEKASVKSASIPSDEQLKEIRRISSRRQVQDILPILRIGLGEETCGECFYLDADSAVETLKDYIAKYGKIVVKAPWSCSGRGVRYLSDAEDAVTIKWAENIIRQQGGVTIEPYYNKVTDFAVEFESKNGKVEYSGLSIFQTINGAYRGNILASKEEKLEEISKYISPQTLDIVISRICEYMSSLLKDIYEGPFGVDMMVIAQPRLKGFLLHPCVEINLRRTMGHVALALSKDEDKPKRLMQTVHDVNYQLKISDIGNNYVQIL